MRCQRAMPFFVFWALLAIAISAQGAPDFPKLTGRVVDNAHMLDAASQQQLSQMLAAAEQQTGDQLVVVTLPDLGGMTIENYGYQLGRHWGIGQKGKDNGALLIVAKAEHKIRIEVGYGLEGQLTDAKSSLIIHRIIEPAFKQGDFAAGLINGAAAIIKVLGGNPQAQAQGQARSQSQRHAGGPSLLHTLGFFGLMVAIILLFGGGGGGGRRRRSGLPWIVPLPIGGGFGGFGGMGGGGFGGGFGGGGGSFGGGGASGGW